jgi:hypothetical protein
MRLVLSFSVVARPGLISPSTVAVTSPETTACALPDFQSPLARLGTAPPPPFPAAVADACDDGEAPVGCVDGWALLDTDATGEGELTDGATLGAEEPQATTTRLMTASARRGRCGYGCILDDLGLAGACSLGWSGTRTDASLRDDRLALRRWYFGRSSPPHRRVAASRAMGHRRTRRGDEAWRRLWARKGAELDPRILESLEKLVPGRSFDEPDWFRRFMDTHPPVGPIELSFD